MNFPIISTENPLIMASASPRRKRLLQQIGLPFEGRAHPILKETRAPAVVVAAADMTEELGKKVATAIIGFFASAQNDIDDLRPHGTGLSGML